MKIFKYLFFLILIVIIGGSIYVATIDGEYQAEETMVMNVPVAMVFNEVNEYKTWEDWGPWKEEDPKMIINYPENTSGEGASYSWKGDKEPMDGSMKTLKVNPNKSIDQEITFETPIGNSTSDVYWKFEPIENKTKVTWGMKGEQSFFEKLFMAFEEESMSEMLHPMFESGLKNLNDVLTEKMKKYSINIDGVTEYGGTYYMYLTTASKNNPKALSAKMEQLFPTVANFMSEMDIEMSGQPMTIYNQINEENNTVIFSCAIPTPTEMATPPTSDVLCDYNPKTTALKVTLKGDYSNLTEAWEKAESYLQKTDFEKNTEIAPFEIYVTDPGLEPNPANWETEIYIPIQRKENALLTAENERI
ncbi:SRPBCC family protein [Mesonia mobilis]|uniref:SRPBCC family protein n=1 Tax=Mesonia mobilis TaxID=369791 RepID=UPI0026EA8D9A|nr:SRPBCC family protein [Mesonia mobilis]